MRSVLFVCGAIGLYFDSAHAAFYKQGPSVEAPRGPCPRAQDLMEKLSVAVIKGTDAALQDLDFSRHMKYTGEVLDPYYHGPEVRKEVKNATGIAETQSLIKAMSPHDTTATQERLHVALYKSWPTIGIIRVSGSFNVRGPIDSEEHMLAALYEPAGQKYHIYTIAAFDAACKILNATVTYGDLRPTQKGEA